MVETFRLKFRDPRCFHRVDCKVNAMFELKGGERQLLTYLRLADKRLGYLLDFGEPR